jgi:pyruvate dehydrogenase E2 component (dihydrolipoamide acetyltransferase)
MPENVFALPDLGEGLTDATIVEWLVDVGDPIAVDQPIVEVETAKARVEVPAPFAGVVAQLHAATGATVPVGAALLTVTQPETAFTEPGMVSAPTDEPGRVLVGYGPSPTPRRHRRSRTTAPAAGANRPVVSPLVRRLAREHGVDLAGLAGSGPQGMVLRRDVEAVLAQAPGLTVGAARSTAVPAQAPGPTAGRAPSTASSTAVPPGARRVPLTGLRGAAAELFARSRREIPEATVWVDADATGLLEARADLNAARPDEPVGLLALLARFAVLGLRRYPELNARVGGDAVVLLDEVHLGFAAQTGEGLVVPVVREAHTMTTRQLAAAIGAHTADARSGTIGPASLTGGTFTVNNYGIFGVDGSAAIINHPEVAILGLGRITDRPWAVDGKLAVRKVTELTLAFDHRACDGAVAGGFLRFVADCVESPVLALGEL